MNINRNTMTFGFLMICQIGFTQSPIPELWQKAVQIAEKNSLWIPGLLKTEEKVLDEDGKVVDKSYIDIELSRSLDGTIVAKIIKEISKSDLSEDEKEELSNDDDNKIESDPSENPFEMNIQHTITDINALGKEQINSISYKKYSYKQEVDGIILNGVAWLDHITGSPLKIEFGSNVLAKEKDYTVTNLQGTVLYNNTSQTTWYPIKIVYEIDMEAEYLIFFTFKGHIEEKIYLSDYFK